jgi:hypothetical protein
LGCQPLFRERHECWVQKSAGAIKGTVKGSS